MNELAYTYDIAIPPVNGLHEVLVAFFRTSKHGPWEIMAEAPNTPFHLVFRRGDWVKRMFGLSKKLVPAKPKLDSHGKIIPRSQAMTLDVLIRPSPKTITINTHHMVLSSKLLQYEVDYHKTRRKYWENYVSAELSDLCNYLAECFDLPTPVRLIPPLH